MATDPPGTPVAPCIKFNLELERERTKEEKEREEVLHLFRCYTHTHSQPCDSLVQDAFLVVGSQLDTLGQEHGSLPKVASAVRRDSRLRDSGDFLLAKCSDLQGLGGVG